ncbi:MAG: PAS domain S-box protein [Chitinophagia bacterium]|nr:PAS domain S-box protein [Chitinophagia bacterium]
MLPSVDQAVELIAQTALHLCDAVLEIDARGAINATWGLERLGALLAMRWEKGMLLRNLPDGDLLHKARRPLKVWVETGALPQQPIKFKRREEGILWLVTLHFFGNHPEPGCLLIGVSRKDAALVQGANWKTILESVTDGVWIRDEARNCITFKGKYQQLFGYDDTVSIAIDEWEQTIHPDDIEHKRELLQEYLKGETNVYATELRYRLSDGHYRWILSRGVAVGNKDGKPQKLIGAYIDVHEQKIADLHYSATTELVTALIDNIHEGIMVTDDKGFVRYANHMFCDMFLYEKPDVLLGRNILERPIERQVEVVDEDTFKARLAEVVLGNAIVLGDDFELKDGRIFSRDYLPLSINTDNKGQIWKFRDVTEQRNISRNFRKQREFYEKMLNSIPSEIIVFDANGLICFLNPAACPDAATREQLMGKTCADLMTYRGIATPEITERMAALSAVYSTLSPAEFEENTTSKEGQVNSQLCRLFPVLDANGNIDSIIGYGVNITEVKAVQQSLKLSNEVLSSAFDYSAIGIGFISPEGRWLKVNDALCKITGYAREELMEMCYPDITFPEDIDNDKVLIERLLNKEIATYSLDKRYVSKGGNIIWVYITVSLVWNDDGTPKFFISQVIDITRQRKLNDAANRQNAELLATRNSLVSKVEQLEEMGHMIAHNLRGPVNNIKLIAESLIATDDDKLFTNEEAGTLIHQSAQRLSNALNSLMELTRIKLDNSIKYDDCNLEDMVADVKGMLLSAIYEKKAVVKVLLEVKQLSYPKIYLESILYNLFSNAIKYSSTERTPEIEISSALIDGRVRITIKDNGIGIDLVKYGGEMFKPNKIFHEGYESKGVGLYLTKTQVENLGGKIEVSSTVNEGTTFVVTL